MFDNIGLSKKLNPSPIEMVKCGGYTRAQPKPIQISEVQTQSTRYREDQLRQHVLAEFSEGKSLVDLGITFQKQGKYEQVLYEGVILARTSGRNSKSRLAVKNAINEMLNSRRSDYIRHTDTSNYEMFANEMLLT